MPSSRAHESVLPIDSETGVAESVYHLQLIAWRRTLRSQMWGTKVVSLPFYQTPEIVCGLCIHLEHVTERAKL